MSTTQTQTQAPRAEFTVIRRVAAIPMITYSFQTIDQTLAKTTPSRLYGNAKRTAKGLSDSAIQYAAPLQDHFGSIITQVDVYANKAVDVVESRYPYPFQAKPEEVASLVQEKRQNATDYVTDKFDANIRNPAINAATVIDKRFSPLVDYYAIAVSRTSNSEAGPLTSSNTKYQYQRVLALSKTLKDNVTGYSHEQLKQLQAQNKIVHNGMALAQSINDLATTSYRSTAEQIHHLSDAMLIDLQKLQTSMTSVSESIRSTVQGSAAQLQNQIPPQIQEAYAELTNNLSASATELRSILAKEEVTLQEKVGLLVNEVQNRITPLLETAKKGISELLKIVKENASHGAPPRSNGT
ncbi:hypothetical protein H0H92_005652 [Tricholoma furcatifolium]|nr:hypothetical protein H0H92_005652 [Tricholoma furcatifolium]